jgi:hypothetical protein
MDEQVKIRCQAAVLRYVHDVVAGEYLNIGIVLFCPDRAYLACKFLPSWQRVTAAFPGSEPVHLRRVAAFIADACAEWEATVKTELLLEPTPDLRSFLAKLVPEDDASLQFSPSVSGITRDPAKTLEELFVRYVGRFLDKGERVQRDDADVWRDFTGRIQDATILKRLRPRVLKVSHFSYEFQHAWKNGHWNVVQAVSLDMAESRHVTDKATQWTGRLMTLRPAEQDTEFALVVGMPHKGSARPVMQAARDAVAILRENLVGQASVLTEDEVAPLASKLIRDLTDH